MQANSIRNQYQQSPPPKPVKYSSQVKYGSQIAIPQPLKLQMPTAQSVIIAMLPQQEQVALLSTYSDMLNQESDLFYLFDSFHSILNSLKQVYQIYTKQSPESKAVLTNATSNSRDTLNWSKVSGLMSQAPSQWTGMKNIKTLDRHPSQQQDSFFNNNNNLSHHSLSNQFTLQSNASAIIDKLKREIGEFTEEQKQNLDTRNIQGLQGVQVQLFTPEGLKNQLLASEKKLLSIYQLQNKYYKCHVGFAVIQVNQDSLDCSLQKMYFAKYHRKMQNYMNMVLQVIKYCLKEVNANKIKIKVNSSQAALIKLFYAVGFKLITQNHIVGDLKIVSLFLNKKDFNENVQVQAKKSYL